MNNRLYIIHPLETYGDIEENRREEQEIARFLRKSTDFKLVRPFKLVPPSLPRNEAMALCLKLMDACGSVILTGDWNKSEGCQIEAWKASRKNIYELKDGEIRRLK